MAIDRLAMAVLLLRTHAGWTQKEMARRLGVSESTIGRWESGAGHMDRADEVALLRELGWTHGQFIEYLDALAAVEEVLDR